MASQFEDPRLHSGIQSVTYHTVQCQWVVSWNEEGHQKVLRFGVEQYGFDRAKELAMLSHHYARRHGMLPAEEEALTLNGD